MSKYKVSIVVPIYNLEKYIPRCLDALVNQTLEDIEIICVNDGSTDSAPQIIEDYKRRYPDKVKTFHKENGGEWSSRTYGLKQATGEYVGFIDSDDYPELTWAEKLYNAAKENDADLALCGYDRIILETGQVVAKEMTQYGHLVKEVNFDDDFTVFVNPSLWNKLYRLEKVKDMEFLPFRGCNDTLFLINAFAGRIKKMAFIPDILYHYYLRGSSQIHSLKEEDIHNLQKYFLVTKENIVKAGKYDEMKNVLDMMAYLHLAISWLYRVSYNPDVNVNKVQDDIIDYLDKNFSAWRTTPFLKFNYCFKKGIKYIAIWFVTKLYKMHLGIIYIKLYRFVVDKLKIDIKW